MGHPKKQRKKYETPKRPYDRMRIEREGQIREEFGLRRKREIWKAESILREFRRRARELLAKPDDRKQSELFAKLNSMGIRVAKLDDVLTVRLEDMLSRRLQTVVYKKGIANTARHARQLIVHGHVSVGETKVLWPSYIVKAGEEERISVSPEIAAKIIHAAQQEGAKPKQERPREDRRGPPRGGFRGGRGPPRGFGRGPPRGRR